MRAEVTAKLALAAGVLLAAVAPAAAQPLPGMSDSQTILLIVLGICLIFFAIGGYTIYRGIQARNLAKASALWPTAGGKVLSSEVATRTSYNRKQRRTTTHYAPQIRYSYKVTGRDYQGTVIRFGDLERTSSSHANELAAKYPPGSTVAVRYDPNDPSRATLESTSAGGRQIVSGIFFIAVPLFILLIFSVILRISGGTNLPPEVLEQIQKQP